MDLEKFIRNVPDFPIEGIQFKDITTMLLHPEALSAGLDELYQHAVNKGVTKVIGIESRGFKGRRLKR